MKLYDFTVVFADHTLKRVVAENIAGVLEKINEDENPAINIFRNYEVSQLEGREAAVVSTFVTPSVAIDTGCRAFPASPVECRQQDGVTLSVHCAKGWKFTGWELDGRVVSEKEQTTVIVEKPGENRFVATFKPAY